MYFGNRKHANTKGWLNKTTIKGWINKTTFDRPMFNPEGSLTEDGESYKKYLEESPLKLHKPTGKPPALLRDVEEWVFREDMSFAPGHTVSHLSFKKDHVVWWEEKVYPRTELIKDAWKHRMKDWKSPARNDALQAWASVLKIGEEYHTYQLDTKKKILTLDVLVPVGKNKWYFVSGRGPHLKNFTEILFEFDNDPITVKEGKVTITRPRTEKLTATFRTEHYPQKDRESWVR